MSNAAMIEEITSAIGAHGAWKLKLRIAISTGASAIDPAKACKDDRCPFGRWIHGPTIDAQTRSGMPYQVVRRLHREFHECAAQVLTYATQPDKVKADELFNGEFAVRSEKLVRALSKWKGELH